MTDTVVNPVPLLIISCDKYADVWRPFFHVFRKRWPDCPFPLYLGTNHLDCHEEGVNTIKVGNDADWASGVLRMLEHLDSSYVILFLEDFLFMEQVDSSAIRRLVDIAKELEPACLRLAPLPPPTPLPLKTVPKYTDIGIVERGSPYRVSAQPAIWRTNILKKLLVPGFSAWDFEHVASIMSDDLPELFLGPLVPYITYDHGVEKGKWKPAGLEICGEAGAEIDLNARPAFSASELDAHLKAGGHASKLHDLKMSSITAYLGGSRLKGTCSILKYIYQHPLTIQPWAILACGILGPRVLQWLRRSHLRMKIGQITRKVRTAG